MPLAPGRSALVARLKASSIADPSKALLLVAHMDVVGVEKAKWTVDPFGAVPKDGYIYGRGAVDDKGMLAANLAAFVALKRANARLNRDVIFLATDDEEGRRRNQYQKSDRQILGQDRRRIRNQRRRKCRT